MGFCARAETRFGIDCANFRDAPVLAGSQWGRNKIFKASQGRITYVFEEQQSHN
jgi:hypothetical protein